MTTQGIELHVDHVCIGVSDLDATIGWYERVLGFELETRWTVPELAGFQLAYIRKGEFRIELIESDDKTPEPRSDLAFDEFLRLRGFSHVCFRVSDVDRALESVVAQGVTAELDPTDFPDVGRRVAFFRDLNGHFIEFAGPMRDMR